MPTGGDCLLSQVLILAAGMGRRLGPLTEAHPKAVIEVGGKALIAHTLRFARLVGFHRRVVVGGYLVSVLRDRVSSEDPEAVLVENDTFDGGNVLSLTAGHRALDNAGFLLMNADHIYGDGVADIVRRVIVDATNVTAFVDYDRSLGHDDMKVELRDGRVARMAKTLDRWDAGYVGITFVPASGRPLYDATLAQAVERHGSSVNVEQLLNDLAADGTSPSVADISGVGWWEVDDESDRDRAEKALLALGH